MIIKAQRPQARTLAITHKGATLEVPYDASPTSLVNLLILIAQLP